MYIYISFSSFSLSLFLSLSIAYIYSLFSLSIYQSFCLFVCLPLVFAPPLNPPFVVVCTPKCMYCVKYVAKRRSYS